MSRSTFITDYLIGWGDQETNDLPTALPPRPPGTVIWARCTHADQLKTVETLGRRLAEEGDQIEILRTLPAPTGTAARRALLEPRGKRNARSFLAHWRPSMVLWLHGDLEHQLLNEVQAAQVPCFLLNAYAEALEPLSGRWIRGLRRTNPLPFEQSFALNGKAAHFLIKAGLPEHTIHVSGPLEDSDAPLSHSEDERHELARVIGTRPSWLAAAARLNELPDLAKAHENASSRAHRLLLIIVPADESEGPEFARKLRAEGYHVTLASDGDDPVDTSEIHIADLDEGLGLWYRLASITYLGGSLLGGGCRDPFEPAALGSAVVHGPHIARYLNRVTRLAEAGASRRCSNSSELGPIVEELLSTEKVAQMAHAAWSVTSRGADVTNEVAELIMARLETLDT